LQQSHDFSRTHNALISSFGTVGISNYRTINAEAVKSFLTEGALTEEKRNNIFETLFKIGMFSKYDEEWLIGNGFKKISDITELNSLKNAIFDNKIYYKRDDGFCYSFPVDTVIGSSYVTNKVGRFTTDPWSLKDQYAKKELTSSNRVFRQYAGSVQSIGSDEETQIEIGTKSISLGSEDYDQESVSFGDDSAKKEMLKRLESATIILPEMSEQKVQSLIDRIAKDELIAQAAKKTGKDNVEQEGESIAIRFREERDIFVERFLKIFAISRKWSLIAVNSQFDFLTNTPESKIKPKIETPKKVYEGSEEMEGFLRQNIPNIIGDILGSVREAHQDVYEIQHLREQEVISDFLENFDIYGLINLNLNVDKFFGLGTFTEFYKGFKIPFIQNVKNSEDGKKKFLDSLEQTVTNFFSAYFSNVANSKVDVNSIKDAPTSVGTLAQLLLSPYDIFDDQKVFEKLKVNPVVSYTGKSFILSYCVEMIDQISTVFSTYFFDPSSRLYLGSLDSYGIQKDIMSLISNSHKEGATNLPDFLIMEDQSFEESISWTVDFYKEVSGGKNQRNVLESQIKKYQSL
jgi:hypothetical protein